MIIEVSPRYISFLCDSTVSSALNFCFLSILLHPKRKRYYIRRKINSKEKNVYIWNQYYYFDLPKIGVGRARTTKNQVAFALSGIFRVFGIANLQLSFLGALWIILEESEVVFPFSWKNQAWWWYVYRKTSSFWGWHLFFHMVKL